MAMAHIGYTKFYLRQPITIRETVETIEKLDNCPMVKKVVWRPHIDPHYSEAVAVISWIGRGSHLFQLEMGTQWENRTPA